MISRGTHSVMQNGYTAGEGVKWEPHSKHSRRANVFKPG